jgi:hypothetical protein
MCPSPKSGSVTADGSEWIKPVSWRHLRLDGCCSRSGPNGTSPSDRFTKIAEEPRMSHSPTSGSYSARLLRAVLADVVVTNCFHPLRPR